MNWPWLIHHPCLSLDVLCPIKIKIPELTYWWNQFFWNGSYCPATLLFFLVSQVLTKNPIMNSIPKVTVLVVWITPSLSLWDKSPRSSRTRVALIATDISRAKLLELLPPWGKKGSIVLWRTVLPTLYWKDKLSSNSCFTGWLCQMKHRWIKGVPCNKNHFKIWKKACLFSSSNLFILLLFLVKHYCVSFMVKLAVSFIYIENIIILLEQVGYFSLIYSIDIWWKPQRKWHVASWDGSAISMW